MNRAAQLTRSASNRNGTWWYDGGPYALGMFTFGVRGETPEWNLAVVGDQDRDGFSWSRLGLGVSLQREELSSPEADPLRGVELKPWLGGCVTCIIAPGVQLNIEGKWTPGKTSLVGAENNKDEGRLGAALELRW